MNEITIEFLLQEPEERLPWLESEIIQRFFGADQPTAFYGVLDPIAIDIEIVRRELMPEAMADPVRVKEALEVGWSTAPAYSTYIHVRERVITRAVHAALEKVKNKMMEMIWIDSVGK